MASNSATAASSDPMSGVAEIHGLREQIIANGVFLHPGRCNTLQVIVTSVVWPQDGYFTAKLIDYEEKIILLGRQGCAPSVHQALCQLLKESCDEIRDGCKLDQYITIDRYTE